MWRIPLAFILLIVILFVTHRIGDHLTIAQNGGIRKKYNRIFSFIYSLQGSELSIESKSYVRFKVHVNSCKLLFVLNYNMDVLDVKCTISYYDDTAFNNGTTKKWTVSKYCNEEEVLKRMQEYLMSLPNSVLSQR